MNREEVKTEVARIINEQLDACNEVENVAGLILDFLDGIGYDASHELLHSELHEKIMAEFG